MNTTMDQLRRLYGISREPPTTGLRMAPLSMIDGHLETYQRNYKCYPAAISLNQKQWELLTKSAQLAGLELIELSYRSIRFHLVEESPVTGRPGNKQQF